MSGGRKRYTPRARHVTHQDPSGVPGRSLDGVNTKLGRQREKAARRAAKRDEDARAERAEEEGT